MVVVFFPVGWLGDCMHVCMHVLVFWLSVCMDVGVSLSFWNSDIEIQTMCSFMSNLIVS